MWPPTEKILTERVPGLDDAELVQQGGQKAVFKAAIDGQVVALKVIQLPKSGLSDEDVNDNPDIDAAIARAEREVSILEQVDVPFLTKRGPLGLSAIEIGDRQCLYFTEEWIEGITLQDKIRSGRLEPEQVARLGVDLISAVGWLSDRGIIHRDIKPANVMWATSRARFVLLDPGIALDLHGPSITRVPLPVGTAAYLSPEQMDASRKRSLDFRSDLFAVGLVMYEAAVAEHPFMSVNTTVHEVLMGILTGTPQPVVEKVDGFPTDLSNMIARLLGKVPHLRYRKCDLAYAVIQDIAVSLGVKV